MCKPDRRKIIIIDRGHFEFRPSRKILIIDKSCYRPSYSPYTIIHIHYSIICIRMRTPRSVVDGRCFIGRLKQLRFESANGIE